MAGVSKAEIAALLQSDDPLTKRLATSLSNLSSNLAKAQAQAATDAVNNEQRFHQLESETLAARMELQSLQRLRDDSVTHRDRLNAQLTTQATELSEAHAKVSKLSAELSKAKAKAEEATRGKDEVQWVADSRGEEAKRAQAEVAELSKRLAAEVQARVGAVRQLDDERHKALSLQGELARAQSEAAHAKVARDTAEKELRETSDKLSRLQVTAASSESALTRKVEELKKEAERAGATTAEWKDQAEKRRTQVDTLLEEARGKESERASVEAGLKEELQSKTRLCELAKQAGEDMEHQLVSLRASNTGLSQRFSAAQADKAAVQALLDEAIAEHARSLAAAKEAANSLQTRLDRATGARNEPVGGRGSALLERILASSPAQVAGDLLREGKISEVYTVLEHTCALLHEERASRERAEACLEAVVEELEAKGPMILQQRQESETAKMSSQQASARLQGALAEVAALGQQNRVLASQRERFVAETAALERLCADLSMQCRALLREVEELRAGRAGASGVSSAAPNVPADALTAEKVVSDQLVIYRNIEELQGQNQKLLSVVRQLSEDQERESSAIKQQLREELGGKVEAALSEVDAIREQRIQLEQRLHQVTQQRDMYRVLLTEADRSLLGEADPSNNASLGGVGSEESQRAMAAELERIRVEAREQARALQGELDGARKEATAAKIAQAQARSDLGYLRERMDALEGTSQAQQRELQGERQRLEGILGRNESLERMLSQHMSDTLSAQERERAIGEERARLGAEKQHWEFRAKQSEETIEALRQDKAGIHALLKQMELAREDEVKRATAELEGVRKDLSRKENEWAEARREATSERTRADTERESGEIKVRELRESLRAKSDEVMALSEAKIKAETALQLAQMQAETATAALRNAQASAVRVSNTSHQAGSMPVERVGEGEAVTRVKVLESELLVARQAVNEKQSHADNWKMMAEQSEAALSTMREHARVDKERASKQVAVLESELATKRAALEQAQQQLDAMTKTCKGLERELDDAKQNSEARNGGLENQVTQLDLENHGLKGRLELIEREGRRAEEQRTAAVADYEREVARHAEKLTALSDAREALSAARAQLSGLEAQAKAAEGERTQMSEQWAEEKRSLVREREEARARARELEQHVALLQKHLDREAASKAAASASSAGAVPAAGGAEDVVELMQQLTGMKHRKDLAEARLLDAEQESSRLRQRAGQDSRALAELKGQLEGMMHAQSSQVASRHEYDSLRAQIAEMSVFKESNTSLRAEAKSASDRAAALELELVSLRGQLLPLNQTLGRCEAEKKALALDNTQLKEQLERWQKRAGDLQGRYGQVQDSAEAAKLKETVAKLEAQVSMLHATEKGLKGEVDRLGKALADSLAKAKALEGSAASSAEFTAKVAELEKRVEELTSKNTYLTTNGQKYLQKTTIQKQDIKKLNEEVAELRASAAAGGGGGEAETKAAKEELDKARAAAAASEDACALLKKKVEALEALASSPDESEPLRKMVETLEKDAATRVAAEAKLKREKAAGDKALAQAKAELAQAMEKLGTLEEQVAVLSSNPAPPAVPVAFKPQASPARVAVAKQPAPASAAEPAPGAKRMRTATAAAPAAAAAAVTAVTAVATPAAAPPPPVPAAAPAVKAETVAVVRKVVAVPAAAAAASVVAPAAAPVTAVRTLAVKKPAAAAVSAAVAEPKEAGEAGGEVGAKEVSRPEVVKAQVGKTAEKMAQELAMRERLIQQVKQKREAAAAAAGGEAEASKAKVAAEAAAEKEVEEEEAVKEEEAFKEEETVEEEGGGEEAAELVEEGAEGGEEEVVVLGGMEGEEGEGNAEGDAEHQGGMLHESEGDGEVTREAEEGEEALEETETEQVMTLEGSSEEQLAGGAWSDDAVLAAGEGEDGAGDGMVVGNEAGEPGVMLVDDSALGEGDMDDLEGAGGDLMEGDEQLDDGLGEAGDMNE